MKRWKVGAMRKQAGVAVAMKSGTPNAGGALSAGMHENGLSRRRQARMSPKLIRVVRRMSGRFPMSSASFTPGQPCWQREVFTCQGPLARLRPECAGAGLIICPACPRGLTGWQAWRCAVRAAPSHSRAIPCLRERGAPQDVCGSACRPWWHRHVQPCVQGEGR